MNRRRMRELVVHLNHEMFMANLHNLQVKLLNPTDAQRATINKNETAVENSKKHLKELRELIDD